MKKVLAVVTGLFCLLAGLDATAQEKDVKGGKDHPLLTRMPDFHIADYKEADYASHRFTGRDKKPVTIEGHKFVIGYRLDKGAAEPGELKIRRNVQNALKKVGGQDVHEDNFNRANTIVLQKDGKETWVEVRSFATRYVLTIVEREEMEQVIEANAEAMGNDLRATGHVSVYGILFDTGKSTIKPESDAAIAEIAKLLDENGSLKLHVVGHTDNVGSFDANLKLSKERAEAVMNTLVSKHGIAAPRLKAYGVSSLSPVASNDTDEGKARNRRVELVQQ